MTSVVLPSLKRSITDIMDEELYQLPNSPIQVGAFQHSHHPSQQLAGQPQRSDSPKLAFRGNSVNGSPAMTHSQLYSHPNMSNSSNLSNFLTIPDSFVDYKHNPAPAVSAPMYDSNAMDVDMTHSQPRINPFTDYANPDSLNTTPPQDAQSYYPPLPQQFPTKPDLRTRITFLDEDQANNKKDEEYLLFNPDIQPSHLINHKFWSDDSSPLFVPPSQFNQTSNVQNDFSQQFLNNNNNIIPGYENDYLSMDAFDEEVEEELSDDDEDDSKYFHVDDEFDQLVMNQNGNNFNETDVNLNFMDLDEYLRPTSNTVNMSSIEQKLDDNDIKHDDFFGLKHQQEKENDTSIIPGAMQEQSPVVHNDEALMIDEDLANMNMEDEQHFVSDEDDEEGDASKYQLKATSSHHHMSAAEISASNPTHACDLINPSNGKPCNKQFSRPYDLIRHQETIHASKKKIFRCVICEGRMNGGSGNGKSKTFSRGDALSRHIKVKHGLVGKEALELINAAKDNVEFVLV